MIHISNLKNSILCGDCLEKMLEIPSNSIDLVITSPPYFQQRDYGNGVYGIGNEDLEKEYLDNILQVFKQSIRVVKDTGTVVFNLGDKYINGALSLLPYKFAIKAVEQQDVFLINQLTWSKLNPTPRQDKRKLIQATEPFFIFAKSKKLSFRFRKLFSAFRRTK